MGREGLGNGWRCSPDNSAPREQRGSNQVPDSPARRTTPSVSGVLLESAALASFYFTQLR
jgi:hypothetical protein